MIFSQRLRLYNEVRTTYTNNTNYLLIMRYVTMLLDKDDEENISKSFQVIKNEIKAFAIEVSGKTVDDYTNQEKDDSFEKLKQEVDSENFEW